MSTRHYRTGLVAILLLAAALRFSGISFGLPGTYRPDEEYLIWPAKHFLTGDLNPRFFIYPSLYMYFLSAIFFIYKTLGTVSGFFHPEDFQTFTSVRLDAPLYFLARSTTAALGVAGVAATAGLANRLFGRKEALAAALILSVTFTHVRDSHFATVDIVMTLLCTLALSAMIMIVRRGSWFDYGICGMLIGLAVSSKYTALGLLVPLAFAHVGRLLRIGSMPWRLAELLRIGLMLAAIVCFFALTSPFVLLEWQKVQQNYAFQRPFLIHGFSGPQFVYGWTWVLSIALRYGVGYLLLIPAATGAMLALLRSRRDHVRCCELLVPISFACGLAVVFANSKWIFLRYITPTTPCIAVFAALPFTLMLNAFAVRQEKRSLLQFIAPLLLFACCAPSLSKAISFDRLLRQIDTREMARNWIDFHLDPREQLLIHSDFFYGKPLYLSTRYKIFARSSAEEIAQARWLIVDRHPIKHYVPEVSPEVRELIRTRGRLVFEISPFKGNPGAAVYDQHDAFFVPIDGFTVVDRPGPRLQMYRLE